MYLKGLSFHYVNDVSEVLNFALLDEKVKNAIGLLSMSLRTKRNEV